MQQNKNKHKTSDFQFKQFLITGGTAGMPVSTDGVLLGAWANLTAQGTLLDIGTGTGLLALMCAQRFPHLTAITAIDIEASAIEAAKYNVAQSPWSQRIQVEQANAEHYQTAVPFTDIICNPPYFLSGKTSSIHQRAIARHVKTLQHTTLIHQCYNLTTSTGQAHFILPVREGLQFMALATAADWQVSRYCEVIPCEGKTANRLLLSFTKQQVERSTQTLTIRHKQGYSDEFIQLTKGFYLKM